METAISAVIGELVSQFISFLKSKCSNNAASEEQKMGRLQHLLRRVRTVVEEADGRHITNSGMVEQLQVLADAMYRGYHLLDSFSYGRPNNPLMEEDEEVSSNTSSLSFQSPPKRCRTITFGRKTKKAVNNNLIHQSSLDDTLGRLETAVAHMTEFVVLLGGCERLSHRPYDAHLYIDNFMFGRHAEKQRLFNFLLHDHLGSPLPVLSVVGDRAVGKRTLVAHVCSDERVTSHFSLILNLNEGDLFRVVEEEHERLATKGKILIVVEFDSGVVDEEDWVKFYSSMTNMKKGSKVVIISTKLIRNLETFATVKPIFLSTLPYEEFRYLFKILAFGSTNPMEHPQLLKIVDELSKELQQGWTLVTANVLGEVLRTNLDVRFWLCVLNRARRIAEKNMSVFGAYPNALVERGHHVVTDLELTPGAPFHLVSSTKPHVSVKKELPEVTIQELMTDPTARPKGEFNIIIWQSRMPPFTCFSHFVPNCDQGMMCRALLSGTKRRGVPL